jgi:hypothetical protein
LFWRMTLTYLAKKAFFFHIQFSSQCTSLLKI